MDDPALKLLQELGGAAAPPPASPAGGAPPPSAEPGAGADGDPWRILLVDLVFLLNSLYRDAHYWEGLRTEKDTFRQFLKVLNQLREVPGHDGRIRLQQRAGAGRPAGGAADYEISLGEVFVDRAAIGALIKRRGIRFKHLEGRFLKPLETFAAEGIDSFVLTIPEDDAEENDRLRAAMRVLSCFRQAADKGQPIAYTRNGQPLAIPAVTDERGRPDLNLTLVAVANDLPAEDVQDIVRKVAALMQRPEAARLRRQAANLYRALFAIKSLSARLRRPPLEVNADRRGAETDAAERLDAGAGAGYGSGGGLGGGAPPSAAESGPPGRPPDPTAAHAAAPAMDEGAFKVELARTLRDAFRENAAGAGAVARTLFANDFSEIGIDVLGQRLGLVNHLVQALQKNPEGARTAQAVLERLQNGLSRLPDHLLNDLVVENGVVRAWDGEKERAVGQVGAELAGAIDKAKDQAAVRAKTRPVSGSEPIYMARDLAALAGYFGLPEEEMRAILGLFRACHDGSGRFQRAAFEKKVPEFARYPRRVLHVLWGFLKEIPERGDRIALLNGLQFLVKALGQPILAVRLLVSDFLGERSQVNFSDRNAMMLAVLFLRTYNQEANIDIELTPEEVLRVKVGLDPKVAAYAAWKIQGERNRFLEKAVAIRKRLLEALDPGRAVAAPMPVRFLLSLEREVHMFLSLAGGETASAILQSALAVYGNPESAVWAADEGRQNLAALLQHVTVLIRGIGRGGGEGDLILLDQVRQRERAFAALSREPRHAALVRRVFSWIEPAKQEIRARITPRG
jgi:hypothetical protein